MRNKTDNTSSIIEKINQSKKVWILPYGFLWNLHHEAKTKYENTSDWEKKRYKTYLPNSRDKEYFYSPKEICFGVSQIDPAMMMNHLVVLISLWESLPPEKRRASITSKEEKYELILADQTRNCYLHRDNKVKKGWIKAYKDARNENPSLKRGEEILDFPNLFGQIEDWTDLIIKLSNKIKDKK